MRNNILKRIKDTRSAKKSLKRYQSSSKIKQQEQEIAEALIQRNKEKKITQFNPEFSENFAQKTKYINFSELPFTTAEQVLVNLDMQRSTGNKRSKRYTEMLIAAGYVETVVKNLDLFHEEVTCSIIINS